MYLPYTPRIKQLLRSREDVNLKGEKTVGGAETRGAERGSQRGPATRLEKGGECDRVHDIEAYQIDAESKGFYRKLFNKKMTE